MFLFLFLTERKYFYFDWYMKHEYNFHSVIQLLFFRISIHVKEQFAMYRLNMDLSVVLSVLNKRFYGVVVSTLDFESSDLGSTPGRTFTYSFNYFTFSSRTWWREYEHHDEPLSFELEIKVKSFKLSWKTINIYKNKLARGTKSSPKREGARKSIPLTYHLELSAGEKNKNFFIFMKNKSRYSYTKSSNCF